MPTSAFQQIVQGGGKTSLKGPSIPLHALKGFLSRNQAVAPAAISSSSEVYAQSAAQCARNIGTQIKAYKQKKKKKRNTNEKQSDIKTPENSVSAMGFLLSFVILYRI